MMPYQIVENVAAALIHHCDDPKKMVDSIREAGWHHELTDLAFPSCGSSDEYAINLDHIDGLLVDLAETTADWRERSLR